MRIECAERLLRPTPARGIAAIVHALEVWAQDDDFDVLAQLEPRLRGRRG